MLEYFNKKIEEVNQEVMVGHLCQRVEYEKSVDRYIKNLLLANKEDDVKPFLCCVERDEGKNELFQEICKQAKIIRENKNIMINENDGRDSSNTVTRLSDLLTDEKRNTRDKNERLQVLRLALEEVLDIVDSLGQQGVYPGPINLQSIYIFKGDHEGKFHFVVGNAQDFQIGCIKQTQPAFNSQDELWQRIPFFDERLQSIANARLIAKALISFSDETIITNKMIEENDLLKKLNETEFYSVEQLKVIIGEWFENLQCSAQTQLNQTSDQLQEKNKRIAFSVVMPSCTAENSIKELYDNVAVINNIFFTSAIKNEFPTEKIISSYAWCEGSNSLYRVKTKDFSIFDRDYIPAVGVCKSDINAQFPLIKSYMSVETMLRCNRDTFDRLFLFIFIENDACTQTVIENSIGELKNDSYDIQPFLIGSESGDGVHVSLKSKYVIEAIETAMNH